MRVETNSQSDSEGSVIGGVVGSGGGGGGNSGIGNGNNSTLTNNAYSALPDRSDSPIENNKCSSFQPASVVYSMRSIGKFVVISFFS